MIRWIDHPPEPLSSLSPFINMTSPLSPAKVALFKKSFRESRAFLSPFFAVPLFTGFAFAANLELTNDPSTGGPGQFAESEIRREAAGNPTAAQITLTVEKKAKAPPQSYRIERDGAQLRIIGADQAGAMYGGLDIAEAIHIGKLDTLQSS